jgi:hypothetical protein
LKEKRKGKERQELQTMVVNQEEQEIGSATVKPLAQLSPLKEVRQPNPEEKSKIHHTCPYREFETIGEKDGVSDQIVLPY